ncbi:MAG: hypothetical protein IPM35_18885 [Myxococcales bacterium]|nr:hypothetical protein [Myxococcales bacterium]
MGRQVGHYLSEMDEQRLIDHLKQKFPVLVVDSVYPSSWDRQTLKTTRDARNWVIVDQRAIPVLLDLATRLDVADPVESSGWLISSRAFSCVDWNRGSRGRLYLNTTPDLIWTDISAATGDDVGHIYERACRWIKSNCTNRSSSRTGFWVSRELVPEYEVSRKEAEARRLARPQDPRDELFYGLKRKPTKRLTANDRATLIRYCDAMMAYLGDDAAAESWKRYRSELEGASGS